MSDLRGLREYLIEDGDLTAVELNEMGQAVLLAIQGDAARFQTDIPELKTNDPLRAGRIEAPEQAPGQGSIARSR